MTCVLIVAGNATAADGVRRALRYAPTCRVLGWVHSRQSYAGMVGAPPQLVVLDDAAGVDTILERASEIRAAHPEAKLVLLSRQADDVLLNRANAAGVDAVISKSAAADAVGVLVREIAAGNIFRFAPAPAAPAQQASVVANSLTTREKEILALVASGLSNGHIAAQLWVTEQTVKFHLSNIYRKLSVANRTQAAHYVYLNGLERTVDGHAQPSISVAA